MRITEALPHLPAAVAFQTLHTLIGMLPRPFNDTTEARETRDEAAIAAVAVLRSRHRGTRRSTPLLGAGRRHDGHADGALRALERLQAVRETATVAPALDNSQTSARDETSVPDTTPPVNTAAEAMQMGATTTNTLRPTVDNAAPSTRLTATRGGLKSSTILSPIAA